MKTLKLFAMICLACCFFITLEANGAPQVKTKQLTPTNPTSVLLVKQNSQNNKYQKIGVIKVANHNFVGIKRQEADIDELLQAHAANLGGNAVVDIHSTPKDVYGTVVKLLG